MRRARLIRLCIGLALAGYVAVGLYTQRDRFRKWFPAREHKRLEPPADPTVRGRPLHEWVEDLSNPAPDVRRLAAETLGESGKSFPRAENVVRALGELLHDPDVKVQAAAVAAFGKVHTWAANELATLMELTQAENCEVRAAALRTLAPFIETNEPVEQLFRLAIRGNNPRFQDLTLDVLLESTSKSAGALALLTEALRSENEALRIRALTACGRMGPSVRGSFGAICELLRHPSVALRRKAAEAAGHVSSDRGLDATEKSQNDEQDLKEEPERDLFGRELNEGSWLDALPDSGKIKATLVAALRDSDDQVRAHVARTIGNLGATVSEAKPALLDLLKDSSVDVRANAVAALGRFGPAAREDQMRLLPLMTDPDPRVRWRAIAALRMVEAEPKAQLKPLISALEAPDKPVNDQAAATIGWILGQADKLADEEYKEVFFALMRTEGDALEHLSSTHPKVALILLPAVVDTVRLTTGEKRLLWMNALTELLRWRVYANEAGQLAVRDPFSESESGPQARAAIKIVVPLLVQDLDAPDESMRIAAARALAQIDPQAKAGAVALRKRLKSKEKRVVLEALSALRNFFALLRRKEIVPELIDLLRRKDGELQAEAASFLRTIEPAAKEAVPALLEIIRDPLTEASAATKVALALGWIDPVAAKRALKGELNPHARRALEPWFTAGQ